MNVSLAERGVALSDRLRELRHAAGLSQEQLARRANVTTGVVHKLEQGRVDDPQWSTIQKLAKALNASLDDLAAAQNTPAKPVDRKAGRPKK